LLQVDGEKVRPISLENYQPEKVRKTVSGDSAGRSWTEDGLRLID